jgi:peptide/nickel transport system substrate-binding protein
LALAYALDRDSMAEILPPNYRVATGGLVPPVLQGHTPDIVLRFDPDLARTHFERSGFTGELVFAAAVTVMHVLSELTVAAWRDVLGLDARWNRVPPERWIAAETPWEFGSVTRSLWYPGYPDPEYFLRLLLHSESTDNVGGWSDARYDALIEAARAERDGGRRLEQFHAADRLAVTEEAAVIPLAYAANPFVIKPWLTGWWEYGKSWSSFADLVIDEEARRTT